jgi:Na+/melibiose symporter-like transporter
MIVTQRKDKIPFAWILLITLPVFADSLSEWCGTTAMTFSITKIKNDPTLVTFLHSFNFAFNFMVVPVIAWYSDRIWTRMGRRKPFIILGWLGMIGVQILLPQARNIVSLSVLVVMFHFLVDCAITGPYEPLIYEVVPTKQRGWAGSCRAFFSLSTNLFFGLVLLKRFESEQVDILGLAQVSGEQFTYWTLAVVQGAMVLHLLFNVREVRPDNVPEKLEHFNPRRYFASIFSNRQWLLLYALVFAQVAMIKGLAAMRPLLIKDQFGYSVADFGRVQAFVSTTQMCIIPIAGFFATRFDRLKVFMWGVFLSTLYPITYYSYVRFVVPDGIPPLWGIMAFDCTKYALNAFASVALMPLLFDYIPKNKMSTLWSGTIFARGVSHIVIVNAMSWYVKLYSTRIAKLPEEQWDYISGCHVLLIVNLVACAVVWHFYKQRKKGRVIEYGTLGLDEGE